MFRAIKVVGYMRAMRRFGFAPRQLLAGTGVDPKRVADADYLITLEQYEAVVANMMRLSGNPGIAFTLGSVFSIADLGILGYAMLSAKSLRQATGMWGEYSNSVVGTPINIESYKVASPGYVMSFTSTSGPSAFQRFETEEMLVQGTRLVQEVSGIEPVIGRVAFAYPEPSHSALYRDFFKCPVEFDAAKTLFHVLKPDIDAPLRSGNEELFQMCTRHCRQVMRPTPQAGLLRSRIRSLFLTMPGNLPDLEGAAATLGMSAITLRRRLEADGISYQSIKDEFRFDLAREYLRSGHMAPKQVAYLLGFATPSAFSRAFKSWSGQTVGQYLSANKP